MLTLQFVKFFKLAQDKFEAVRACVRACEQHFPHP